MLETTALILEKGNDTFKLANILVDGTLQPQDVLVDILASGICHTDIAVQKHGKFPGKFPRVLGHEGAGIVKAIGSGITHVKPGDRVILSFAYCNQCRACEAQVPGVCYTFFNQNNNGGRPDGSPTMFLARENGIQEPIHGSFFGQSSFARLSICHGISVIPVSSEYDSVPIELLAPFGCGFQTGAGAVINVVKPEESKPRTLAVFGIGAVGFSALFAAKATSPADTQIIGVDIVPSRLALAEELGFKIIDGRTVNLSQDGALLAAIKEVTGGLTLDAAVDTTGHSLMVPQILQALAPLGKLVTLANASWDQKIEVKIADLMVYAKQWVGSIEGNSVPQKTIPQLLALYKAGKFPVDRLCKTYNAKDINQAIKDSEKGATIKPLLVWD